MKRRSIIRICSFGICAAAALCAFAASSAASARDYKTRLEAVYQRELMQLSECLDSVETDLMKSRYCYSAQMMGKISGDIYSQCCTAKNALSSLPVDQPQLTGTYKFLSQTGDYARSLSKKEKITQKEYDDIETLLAYAEKYSELTDELVARCNAGGSLTENEISSLGGDARVSGFSADFAAAEETFEDYPTLLYDGPFADAVLERESELIASSPKADQAQCRRIAAKALGVDEGGVVYKTEESGKLPAYVFSYKLSTVAVTKNGGYVAYILNEGAPSVRSVTEENAVNIARDFLNKTGYTDMKESYYSVYNNVCTINFAYCKDGITYYSDLIKVGVSLADGSIFSLEADGYLMNHTSRETPAFAAESSEERLPEGCRVISESRCLIPKSDGTEAFCREYRCRDTKTGREVLIYTDSETGEQEDILLLLYSDNGTLTK